MDHEIVESSDITTMKKALVGFQEWVQEVTPSHTGRVVLCGGFAVMMHGGTRATTDVDTAIDLTKCGTGWDTNKLKDKARLSEKFETGLKIYYKVPNEGKVQVDFVPVDYFNPWSDKMLTTCSAIGNMPILTIPTLLWQKLISATERHFPLPEQTLKKQLNDIMDFDFLLERASEDNLVLDKDIHTHHDVPATITAFFLLAAKISSAKHDHRVEQWNALVSKSGVGDQYLKK